MFPVNWCEICQKRPAEGTLTGYFINLQEEVIDLQTCRECAEEALDKGKKTR